MEQSIIWEITKFVLTVCVVPFCVWIVKANMDMKKEVAIMKEDALKFKTEVAERYAPKQDLSNFSQQIDTKITSMQNTITQRIDTMQSNIATMIASLVKGP